MSFNWVDLVVRAVLAFLSAFVAFAVANYAGVLSAEYLQGALFAGLTALINFLIGFFQQGYGVVKARRAAKKAA